MFCHYFPSGSMQQQCVMICNKASQLVGGNRLQNYLQTYVWAGLSWDQSLALRYIALCMGTFTTQVMRVGMNNQYIKSSDVRYCHITLFHIKSNSCDPSQGSVYLTYYYSQLSHFVIEGFTSILCTKLQFIWSF